MDEERSPLTVDEILDCASNVVCMEGKENEFFVTLDDAVVINCFCAIPGEHGMVAVWLTTEGGFKIPGTVRGTYQIATVPGNVRIRRV